MDLSITQFIKTLILPPGSLIILLAASIFLFKISKSYARLMLTFVTSIFFLMTLPVTSMTLINFLESYPALTANDAKQSNAGAIVILGGGREYYAAEYEQRQTVSIMTLQRLRYGAYLHKKTQLPILVTGGFQDIEDKPEGELMALSLIQDFKIDTKWQENKSRNTAENAIYTREILKQEQIDEIILVTNAWHMPRAVDIFQRQNFIVTPAPTAFKGFNSNVSLKLSHFMPNASAFQQTYFALHEHIGRIWYLVRY